MLHSNDIADVAREIDGAELPSRAKRSCAGNNEAHGRRACSVLAKPYPQMGNE
jgi:hypothetical protein